MPTEGPGVDTRDRDDPPLLSLNDLVRQGGIAAAELWVPIGLTVGFALALVVTLSWPQAEPAALVVVLVSAAILLPLWFVDRLEPLWRLTSEYVTITGIGALTLTTGGIGSPARQLLLFPVVYGVGAQPTLARSAAVVAYALAWLAGLALAPSDGTPWANLVTEAGVILALATAVWLVRVTLSRSTRRLSTAETLRETLVEGHTDAVYILSPDGTFLEANEATAKLSGRPLDEIVGRSFIPLLAEDELPGTIERFQRALAGDAQSYETAVIAPDGERVSLFVTNVRITEGDEVVGVYGIASDISTRVRERAQLEASERRFRTLAETLREGVYIIRTRGGRHVEFVNDALREMTGLPADEVPHLSSFIKRVHEDDRDRFIAHATAGRAQERPFRMRWVRPDGDVRWLELREAPYLDGDDNEIGLQGTMRDITPEMELQRSTEAALAAEQEAVEHLRRVDDMKNSFLQSVSHELRTPLTSVIGFSQTIRDHADQLGPERVRHLLDRTIANAGKLDRMLSDLLDVDRMSRGVLTVNRAPVELHSLAAKVLEEVTDQVSLTVVASLEPATAFLDAPKVERIIENLVTNADRHAHDATSVWVSTEPCHGGAMLIVEDDGPGVPAELRERILEPFVQGPDSLRAANPGTGVGLALVARFAELHGGTVEIGERRGGGARFVVRFCERHTSEGPAGSLSEMRSST